MADGIEGFLTNKLGPLPVWVYLGVGGGAVLLFVLYRRGASATNGTQTAGALGTSPTSGAVIINPPPTSPTNPPTSGPSTAGPVPTPVWQFGVPQGPHVTHATPQGLQNSSGRVPPGQVWPGDPGGDVQGILGQFGWQWAPVPSGTDSSGMPWTAASYAQALSAAGMGGGSSLALFGDGRHANPATQLLPTQVTQHIPVAGMGAGPGAGARHGVTGKTGERHGGAVHAIHQRTGAPALRVLSLNPALWRPGAGRPSHVRIQ